MKPKLNGITAAARAVIDKAAREQELDEAARIAAEKIPLKDAAKALMQQMDQALERELAEAVRRFLKVEVTDPELQVAGRLKHAGVGEDLFYLMDDTPILQVASAVVERDGYTLKAHRPVRQLLPEWTA